jgi:glucose/mannose transport system substrate-binding protein
MNFHRRLLATAGGLALAVAAGVVAAQDKGQVEVLHWWTSGGEAAALNVLKEDLQSKGIGWQDMPVAGGGGEQAMTVLRARVTAGNPPTAVQMLGYDIRDWAEQGVVADLSETAKAEGWAEVVPEPVQFFSTYDGAWIAAPVNVHSTSWDELIAALDKIQEAGYVPLAHGGQAWQDATIFDAVVNATGGIEFYKAALIDLDPEALGSDTMKEVFDRMAKLRTYVDDNFSGRDWNLATAMVIEGKAGMQMMGDWAKGEFINAGQVPGEDVLCFRHPGTQGTVTFNTDQFVLFQVGEDQREAQVELAKSIMAPSFQSSFNVVKGSVPARSDVSDEAFDACGKKAMADLAEANEQGTLLGSMAHGHAAPAAVKNAVYDVVTAHFNGEYDSETAVEELVNAVEAAQ